MEEYVTELRDFSTHLKLEPQPHSESLREISAGMQTVHTGPTQANNPLSMAIQGRQGGS